MQPFVENTANIPAFLGKLWKMVNDPSIDHLICWSPMGNSFIIQNQAQFWYELLPLYYKHNNMSSFVRQLNMYGFHKMSIVENGTMDADKDEIQFYHKYFQKDQPELLKNIKRKVTTSKASENNLQNILRHDDITKVLTDVKQLKGKQSTVDSQLSTMKQENAVLWRELAILRQKHMKQQQIVNKLIQFLVTLVQPSANSRMGVGVKRRMPLMLHESPPKKVKTKKSNNHDNNDNGPTIHELDNEIEVSTDEFFDQDIQDQGMVTSPTTSTSPHSSEYNKPPSVSSNDGSDVLSDNFWDKPEFVEISHLQKDDVPPNNEYIENNATDVHSNDTVPQTSEKVFLNPTGGDALLSNFANGSYNTDVIDIRNGKNKNNSVVGQSSNNTFPNTNNMRVVAKDVKINNGTLCTNDCSRDDLDLHLESTQTEIDQLRDILHGCNSFDATTLLGDEGAVIPRNELAADLCCLFSDEAPDYGLTNHNGNIQNTNNNSSSTGNDPLVSGGELVNSNNSLIDFNELFDDSIDGTDINELAEADISSTVNTPMVVKAEPMFPNLETDY